MASEYRDEYFEWDEGDSEQCRARNGFDFHAAKHIFYSNRLIERWEQEPEVERVIATGFLRSVLISVIYIEQDGRRRILDAFEADDEDSLDFMVTDALG
jgi:uncharacterized DUF497 family protein